MFRYMLRRQLVEDAVSLRFSIYAAIILSGFIVLSLVFAGIHQDRLTDASRTSTFRSSDLRSSSSRLSNLIGLSQTILMEPQVVNFIADGHEGQMPQGLSVGMLGSRLAARQGDPGEGILSSPDLTSIVQIIFSFFAIVLTFNAISFEKEKGTLRLVLSNSVLRNKLLVTKYVGGILTVGIPFVIGLVLSLILLSFLGIPTLSGSYMTALLLFFVLSLLYMSFFVLLGLFFSITAGSSKNSLVLCLLCWVFVVIVLPKSGGPLLRLGSFSVPTEKAVAKEAELAGRELWNRHRGENMVAAGPEAESTKLNARVMYEASQAEQRVFDLYLDRKMRAVSTIMAVNCISPASFFEYATSAASGTGIDHFARFRRQIIQYQNELVRFFKDQDMKDKDSPHLFFHPDYVSKKPFDSAAVPEFKERSPGLLDRVKDSAAYGSGLLLWNVIMFSLVFIFFQRYDVR